MKNKKKFTLRLSKQQLETLREIAEREKRTVSAVIRNLIDERQGLGKISSSIKVQSDNFTSFL